MHELTKKYRKISIISWWISLGLTIIPSIIFAVLGFYKGETQDKICIGFVAIISIILGLFMLMSKINLKRSIFWVIMFGLIAMFEDLYYMIIILGVCNMIDEIIVSPIHNRYHEDYHTQKQIDKRETHNANNELQQVQTNS